MKLRQSSVVYMVLGIFLALICALHVSQPSVAADAAGPDWLSGVITTDNFQTILSTNEWQSVIGSGQPLECLTAKSWSGLNGYFGVTPVEQDTRLCAVPMASGYMADHTYLAYGDRYWQFLEYNRDESIVPVPGKSSAVIVDSSYPFPKLRYVSDLLGHYSTFTKDIVGNVIRWKSNEAYDFTLKKADGQDLGVEGPLSFSANGRWLYVSSTGKSQMLFDVETKHTLAFAPYQRLHYVRPVSVSNSGRFVAVSERYEGLYIYDTGRCEAQKPDFESRNCGKRNIETDVREAYIQTMANPNNFASFSILALQFKNESTLTVTAGVNMRDGTGQNVSFDVHVDSGPQTTRYLAMGDSFSSGEGALSYRAGTNFYVENNNYNLCHQSTVSYPYLLNKTLSSDWFGDVACSGAEMKDIITPDERAYREGYSQAYGLEDVTYDNRIFDGMLPGYRTQLSFISKYHPSLATISIGGNDIGFGDIVTECVAQKYTGGGNCYSQGVTRDWLASTIDQKIPLLTNTFKTLKNNLSGEQKLYVVGYPQIVNPGSSYTVCGLNVQMTFEERTFASNLIDYLNEAIRLAANNAGVRFVNVSTALYDSDKDYRLCGNQGVTAVNGLIADPPGVDVFGHVLIKKPNDKAYHESYHPNVLGHILLARQIRKMTSNLSASMPEPVRDQATKVGEDFRIKLVGYSASIYDNTMHVKQEVIDQLNQVNTSISVKFETKSMLPPASNSTAKIEIHSNPVVLGEVPIDSSGTTTTSVSIPDSVPLGPHELHIYYTDIAGKVVDIYQYVYVIHSIDDYDGNGVPNSQEQCLLVPASGVDSDHDGIDDACDGEYVKAQKDENTSSSSTSSESATTQRTKSDEVIAHSEAKTALLSQIDTTQIFSQNLSASILSANQTSRLDDIRGLSPQIPNPSSLGSNDPKIPEPTFGNSITEEHNTRQPLSQYATQVTLGMALVLLSMFSIYSFRRHKHRVKHKKETDYEENTQNKR